MPSSTGSGGCCWSRAGGPPPRRRRPSSERSRSRAPSKPDRSSCAPLTHSRRSGRTTAGRWKRESCSHLFMRRSPGVSRLPISWPRASCSRDSAEAVCRNVARAGGTLLAPPCDMADTRVPSLARGRWGRRLPGPAVVLAASFPAGAPAKNSPDPQGPRYSGSFARERATGLKVVTFNIRFARRIDRTEELSQKADHLRGADVIALQEMDAPGTETLARELGYDYVYYPSALHPRTHRDFGNAVLSRWPIQSDHKLVLPHLSGLRRMSRAVTAAALRRPAGLVRVYSVHLATPAELLPQARVDQALAIAEDARGFPGAVIVAGGFNNPAPRGPGFRQA